MASNPADGKRKLLLLFGSETGNSESISKRIHHDANELGYTSDWAPLKDFKNVRRVVLLFLHMLGYQFFTEIAYRLCSWWTAFLASMESSIILF